MMKKDDMIWFQRYFTPKSVLLMFFVWSVVVFIQLDYNGVFNQLHPWNHFFEYPGIERVLRCFFIKLNLI